MVQADLINTDPYGLKKLNMLWDQVQEIAAKITVLDEKITIPAISVDQLTVGTKEKVAEEEAVSITAEKIAASAGYIKNLKVDYISSNEGRLDDPTLYQRVIFKGQPDGYVGLDAAGMIDLKYLPYTAGRNINITDGVISTAEDTMNYKGTVDVLPSVGNVVGDTYDCNNVFYIFNGEKFRNITSKISLDEYAKTVDVDKKLDAKQDTLVAGNGITITGNEISARTFISDHKPDNPVNGDMWVVF